MIVTIDSKFADPATTPKLTTNYDAKAPKIFKLIRGNVR